MTAPVSRSNEQILDLGAVAQVALSRIPHYVGLLPKNPRRLLRDNLVDVRDRADKLIHLIDTAQHEAGG